MVSKLKTPEFKFASRIRSLPVVMTTCIWISQYYERLKGSNLIVKQAFELAEMTINASFNAMTDTITPKFETHINLLDSFACSQLDRIETHFPLINKDAQTIIEQTKSVIQGTSLVAHRLLDRVEKRVTTQPAQSSSNPQPVCPSYPPLVVRARLIVIMMIQSFKTRVEANIRVGLMILRQSFPLFDQLVKYMDDIRQNAAYKLHDRFSITKDKLDLYKEYLDVLSRQFMVQDGRSLEHVHSLEERTKIIIRRNIGNLLILIQIISSNVRKLTSYMFDNAVLAFPKKILELFQKPNNEMVKALKSKLINLQSCALQWLVPNFDAFGVLDELDEELSPAVSFYDDDYKPPCRVASAEFIRRQYALLGNEPLSSFSSNTPISTRTSSNATTTTESRSSNRLFTDS